MKALGRPLARPAFLSALAALALTGLLYHDALSLPLFADDLVQIPWLESASWREIWSSPSPYGYYRPVWYGLWRVWGAATGGLRPFSLHALNLLAHFAAAWLAGLLALAWFGNEGDSRQGELRVALAPSSQRTACLGALVATGLFAIFPFSRQAVAWPGAVYNPLVSAMAAGAIIAYDRGRRRERWGWIGVAAVLAGAAAFTYEAGLMVAPLIVATEAVGWFGRRWRRRLSWWPALFAALTIACLLVWGAIRGASVGGFGLRAPDLVRNLGYLVQGLSYPTAPLAQLLTATTALSPGPSLWIIALPTLVVLGWCAARNGRSAVLLGLAWFVLFAAPPMVSMEADWFALAPRFLYTTAASVALIWTSAVAPLFDRLWKRLPARPALAALIALAVIACLLTPAIVFVRRGMDLYVMAGETIWEAAQAGANAPPVLLVNLPRRIQPARRVYPLGFEGITPLPQRVTAAELVYVHTGVRVAADAVAFGIVASDAPADYAYELHGREVGWVEVADASRRARAVHLTRYRRDQIQIVEAGGRAEDAPAEEMDAVFASRIGLRDALGECDDAGQVRLTAVWQALGAVGTDVAVYAHLVGRDLEDGAPLAQADGYPLLGMRPFWLFEPGEAVRDVRYFAPVPPGSYHVSLGLFEPATGRRWTLDDLPGEHDYSVAVLCQ